MTPDSTYPADLQYKAIFPEALLICVQRDIRKGIFSPRFYIMQFKGKVRKDKHGLPKDASGEGSTPAEAWKVALERYQRDIRRPNPAAIAGSSTYTYYINLGAVNSGTLTFSYSSRDRDYLVQQQS